MSLLKTLLAWLFGQSVLAWTWQFYCLVQLLVSSRKLLLFDVLFCFAQEEEEKEEEEGRAHLRSGNCCKCSFSKIILH